MSQASSTPGRVQSDDSRLHKSLLEENQRLKEAYAKAQRANAFLQEGWEKDLSENIKLRMDLEELRSSSLRTSSDQISIQQWQDRAEEAERCAEETQRRAEEAQRRAEEAQRRAEEAQRRAEEAQRRAEQAEREILKRRNVGLRLVAPKERATLIPKVHRGFAEDLSPRASTEGPASRTLEHPSSQQQSSSRQGGPLNRSNADYHTRVPHETTGAVKAPVLKLDEPSNLREGAIPRGGPEHPPRPNFSLQGVPIDLPPQAMLTPSARSSQMPDIPATSTTSAVPEPPQTETESLGVHQPGAEPAGAQPTDRNCEVNSSSPRTTGDSDKDEEQTPDTISTSVAARKKSKGIPAATSQIRGKYWPRGRIS